MFCVTLSDMSMTLSVRLPDAIGKSLDDYANRVKSNRSTVVTRALDEWTRMQAHPGIRFISAPNGRRVAALERGPEVWTVAEVWTQAEPASRTISNVAYLTGLEPTEVETALKYYGEFQQEIDTELNELWQQQAEAEAIWKQLLSVSNV